MKKIVNSVNIFSINTIFARGDISMDIIRKIENEHLSVKVSDHGAELCSIFDKKNNREVIWQADPEYWNRRYEKSKRTNIAKYGVENVS